MKIILENDANDHMVLKVTRCNGCDGAKIWLNNIDVIHIDTNVEMIKIYKDNLKALGFKT